MTKRRANVIAWACGTMSGFLFGVLILAAGRVWS